MTKMSLEELFDVGINFESAVGQGSKSERARIPKNHSRISLEENTIEFLKSIDFEVNFLVSGEIWCPDFQINISILKKFCDINSNFNISIITMARGKKYLSSILNIDKENFKGPTVCILDKNFNIKGIFEERPTVVKSIEDFESIKLDYYKGQYIHSSVNDFIKILKSI
ncbi:thioredoxin family protein [Romboutsia lituseburensis]|uniref:thioredoxin family protein n=1 Tax=Romboutsia lituseburensis TaxID=1537 RepID=UPI00215A52B0|nr:thioredoxin family protein [Romboutsia lituseburensis]MCR8744907.1 thioredoxin family protein [Romboutsia lituseburensis]